MKKILVLTLCLSLFSCKAWNKLNTVQKVELAALTVTHIAAAITIYFLSKKPI